MSSILIPPGVCGRIRGYISISIDEVLWTGASRGDVYVKFNWWGSEETYEFFPNNLKKRDKSDKKFESGGSATYKFPIGTSSRLLEEYFRKWKSIPFNVYRMSDKKFVGGVRIENWECILFNSTYGSYFPILDGKGNKIGDLHVVFNLKMKKKKKKKSPSKFDMTKTDKCADFDERGKDGECNGNNVLHELLNKGQALRKAMVKSVLSSCDAQDLDEVVGDDIENLTKSHDVDDQHEAKLVDFLMGKELSEPEKEIALSTLRCSSPSESILDVAANIIGKAGHKSYHPKRENFDEERKISASIADRVLNTRKCNKKSVCSKNSAQNIASEPTPLVLFENVNFHHSKFEYSESQNNVERLANSFKVTFGVMTMTALGLKKVSTSPSIRPLNNKIRAARSPGIVFSLETVIPFSLKCKAGYLKPITISSKAIGGNDVIFNEGVVQKFRPSRESAWAKVGGCIRNLPVKVYWRCLNQRLPSLFGLCLFPDELVSENLESSFELLVHTNARQLAATLEVSVEIGVSGVFGNELLGSGNDRKKNKSSCSEVPQTSEGRTSGTSIVSVEKMVVPEGPKIAVDASHSEQVPESSRCCTATSAPSTNYKQIEPDLQLLNAIVNLNEKLSNKPSTADPREDIWGITNDVVEKESTPQHSQRPKSFSCTNPPSELKEDGNGSSKNTSVRRNCCCCCRGCQGDCKRKKLPRKKHVRDRKSASNRCTLANNDDSSPLPYSEGGLSPRREVLSRNMNNCQTASRFHSPPTKLAGKIGPDQVLRSRDPPLNPERINHEIPRRNPVDLSGQMFERETRLPSAVHKPSAPQDLYDYSQFSCLPSVHRFSVNVYSSDAQIFYREGELEFFMVYRFPQSDPVSGKLFYPPQISTLELSGDSPPIVHHLPLKAPLSEALLSYSKHNITFHIWARAYMYEKRDFLVGQAKLPLEKLVEWEAAHVYSQRRRADHPLLPPDKHFVNLRIHPSKGELPANLEPGRIAQLGLEIDYEKFTDTDQRSVDAWPLPRDQSIESPPMRPYYEPSNFPHNEVPTDSSERCVKSFNQAFVPDTMPWNHPPSKNERFLSAARNGEWELNPNNLPGPMEAKLMGSRFISDAERFGMKNSANHNLRSFNGEGLNYEDSEELMLIVDDRPGHLPSSCIRNNMQNNPEMDLKANCTWGDEELQYQSLSRMDAANASDFAPNEDLTSRFRSPRVDRDFPPGVRVADFSSDNNSIFNNNPFEGEVVVHHTSNSGPSQATRIRFDDSKPSPLPSLAKIIDPERPGKRRESPAQNLDSSFELGSDSKATQTTVNETPSKVELFAVRVEVEAAINLLSTLKENNRSQPSTRVEFNAWNKGEEVTVQSSVVNTDSNPKYNSAWSVELPTAMLYKGDNELEIKVVNVEDSSISTAFVDLTTLSAGLPCLNGWYFLSSNGHKSAGQLKVTVTPMENIRKYRDEWIEECRKKKRGTGVRCQNERISCEGAKKIMLSDNSGSKFKEKMRELEQLTERMKKKLMDVERWNDSPPCTLMRDVDNFAKQLIEETTGVVNERSSAYRKDNPCTNAAVMPELDLETVQRLCPVEKEEVRFHSRLSLATSEDSPRNFSDYLLDQSRTSRIPTPRLSAHPTTSRSINNDSLQFLSDDDLLIDFKTKTKGFLQSRSPSNLISFDELPKESKSRPSTGSASGPLYSNDTSPSSPLIDPFREKFVVSDDSEGENCVTLTLNKCHEELERLPKDSLDAASLAIEKMIEELRHHKIEDHKS